MSGEVDLNGAACIEGDDFGAKERAKLPSGVCGERGEVQEGFLLRKDGKIGGWVGGGHGFSFDHAAVQRVCNSDEHYRRQKIRPPGA